MAKLTKGQQLLKDSVEEFDKSRTMIDELESAHHFASEAANALHMRDVTVRAASRKGASLREIAEVTYLSHSAIARIIKRGDD